MALPAWQPLHDVAPAPPVRGALLVAEVRADGVVERVEAPEGWTGVRVGEPVPDGVRAALGELGERPGPLGAAWGGLALGGLRRPGGGFVVFGAPPGPGSPPALVERMPVAVLHLGPDGAVRYANDAAARLAGRTADDLVGSSLWGTLVYPEDRWKLTQALRAAAAGERRAVSFRLRHGDSTLRLVEAHLIPEPGRTGVDAVLLDLTERSEVVAALYHSEALYNTFLEQSPVGLVHLDAMGTVTFENHRFREIVGEEPEGAWIGRSAFRIAGTDGVFMGAVKHLLDGRQVTGYDVRYEPAGRAPRRLLLNGAPIRQEDGHLVGAVLMFQDVTTERAQADEMTLREQFSRAEGALREAVLAESGEPAFLSEAARLFAHATGATRAAVFLPAGSAPGTYAARARWGDEAEAFDGRTLVPAATPALEEGVRRRAPALLHVETPAAALRPGAVRERVAVPFYDGALAGFLVAERTLPGDGFLTGSRERLVAGFAVVFETLWSWLAATTRFRLTVSTIDDGLFSFTLDPAAHDAPGARRYLFLTPQIEAITGHAPDALLDRPGAWEALLEGTEAREALAAHTARLLAGQESEAVYALGTARGTRYVREHATPHRGADGALFATGILADVTERRAAERVLVEARAEAEAASRDKSAFIHALSHELRTPLGALSGFADVLAREIAEAPAGALPAEAAEFAETVREKAHHTLALVNGLFDLSNLDAGRVDVRRVPVPLADVARRVAERAHALAHADVRLETDLDPRAVALADPARVEQIAEHVIGNAFKFTPEGAVRVSTHLAADGRAALTVEDTGIGIAPEFMGRLFTPFVQEDQRLNRDYGGAGLGLALVRRLTDAMGGEVQVTSEKGRGTTFRVLLPAVLPTPDASPFGA